VRRDLLFRVGFLQAAPLAQKQPRQAGQPGCRPRALRHGSGGALRIKEPEQTPRSVCAMGHKWMWNPALGGLPPEDFLVAVDPLLAGAGQKLKDAT